MANRDALWVNDKGQTVPVVLDEDGNRVDLPGPVEPPDEPEPFAGKGDHDDNGKVGGAHAPVHTKRSRKRA